MAKKNKHKIPKRVGGVRIPKFMRKSSMLRALLGTDLGRDILANALTAGAGAAAAVLVQERETVADVGGKGLKKGGQVLVTAGEALESAAGAAIGVVSDAARGLLPESAGKPAKRRKGSARHNTAH